MRRAVASLCVAAVIAALIVTDLFFFPFGLLRARAGAPEIPLRAEGEMRVHIVDVGQGDCAIVEFPDGSSMMIDGGDGAPAHTRAVIGYCMALGIERFGSVLLTHPDSDHAGGLDAVLSAFGAERIYLPMRFPAESGEEEYAGFFAAAEDSGAELIRTRALIPVLPEEDGPFYYGMFLSPLLPHGDAESDNEDSAVLYLEYAGRRFLFTGDAPVSVEESIARAYTETEGEVFTRTVQTGYGTFTLSPALADIDFFQSRASRQRLIQRRGSSFPVPPGGIFHKLRRGEFIRASFADGDRQRARRLARCAHPAHRRAGQHHDLRPR